MFLTYSYRFLISRILSSFLTTYRPFTSSVSIYAIHFLRSLRCWVAIIFATRLHVSHMQYSYMTLLSPVPREFTTSLSLCHATRDIAWTSSNPQTTSSPPFFLRDSRASESRARVKITPREERRHAAGREKNSTNQTKPNQTNGSEKRTKDEERKSKKSPPI